MPFWKRKILLSERTKSLPCSGYQRRVHGLLYFHVVFESNGRHDALHNALNFHGMQCSDWNCIRLTPPPDTGDAFETAQANSISWWPQVMEACSYLAWVDLLTREGVVVGSHGADSGLCVGACGVEASSP